MISFATCHFIEQVEEFRRFLVIVITGVRDDNIIHNGKVQIHQINIPFIIAPRIANTLLISFILKIQYLIIKPSLI